MCMQSLGFTIDVFSHRRKTKMERRKQQQKLQLLHHYKISAVLVWCGVGTTLHKQQRKWPPFRPNKWLTLSLACLSLHSCLCLYVCISLLLLCIPTSCKNKRTGFISPFDSTLFSFSSFPSLLLKTCFNTRPFPVLLLSILPTPMQNLAFLSSYPLQSFLVTSTSLYSCLKW